jgi:hypothetical protein
MQALDLNWRKCPKGYEILEIRTSPIDWAKSRELGFVPPPADATPVERRLLAKWGMLLDPHNPDPRNGGAPQKIVRLIEPRTENKRISNFAQDVFIDFANIEVSEAKLLAFTDKYGPLYYDRPLGVSGCLIHVAWFRKVLGDYKKGKHTGSKRWLESFEALRWRGFDRSKHDLAVVPKLDEGKIQVLLQPADLLAAIWLQFLLKAANDLTLTHCDSCRNFMAVAASLGRSDKRFCSTACKQRDYRRREAEKKASHSVATGARLKEKRRRST